MSMHTHVLMADVGGRAGTFLDIPHLITLQGFARKYAGSHHAGFSIESQTAVGLENPSLICLTPGGFSSL